MLHKMTAWGLLGVLVAAAPAVGQPEHPTCMAETNRIVAEYMVVREKSHMNYAGFTATMVPVWREDGYSEEDIAQTLRSPQNSRGSTVGKGD